MNDRLARKKLAMKRKRETVNVSPPSGERALCPGCRAVDSEGKPTAHQQGCPIAYMPKKPLVLEEVHVPASKRVLRKKIPRHLRPAPVPEHKSSKPEQDEVSEPESEDPEAEADEDERPLRSAKRREAAPADRGSIRQGWYLCVNACGSRRPFYAGYGLSKPPACTGCGGRSQPATYGEVFEEM